MHASNRESDGGTRILSSTDNGHSFDDVLLYGHEFALTIFDMMVFLFVDLFAQDVLLAGIITYFVGEVKYVDRN